MTMLVVALTVAGNLLLTAVVCVILVPYVRLQMQRRQSRAHVPQPGEIWQQNNESILFVQSVGTNGVELLSAGGDTGPQHWHESWSDWQTRLRINTVIFTGERRALDRGNGV